MNKKKAWSLITVNALIIVFLCEVCVRLFGSFFLHAAFFRPQLVILNYYPELTPFLLHKIPVHDSTESRLLILGGSAVSNRLCGLEERLDRSATEQVKHKKFKAYNLAEYAQTSWDSR